LRTSTTRARSNLGLDSSRRASTTSPVSAPSTNTTLPALRATPRPAASSASISSFIPELQEFAPVGLVLGLQAAFQEVALLRVIVLRVDAAQQLVAEVQQVGVGGVRLAVVAHFRGLARQPGFPDLRAADADLARQPGKLR